jgi:hypothetical protein
MNGKRSRAGGENRSAPYGEMKYRKTLLNNVVVRGL